MHLLPVVEICGAEVSLRVLVEQLESFCRDCGQVAATRGHGPLVQGGGLFCLILLLGHSP